MQIPGKPIGINLSLIAILCGDRSGIESDGLILNEKKDKSCGARS
jgi:hypothetical protein